MVCGDDCGRCYCACSKERPILVARANECICDEALLTREQHSRQENGQHWRGGSSFNSPSPSESARQRRCYYSYRLIAIAYWCVFCIIAFCSGMSIMKRVLNRPVSAAVSRFAVGRSLSTISATDTEITLDLGDDIFATHSKYIIICLDLCKHPSPNRICFS